jgi:hypothetical protein
MRMALLVAVALTAAASPVAAHRGHSSLSVVEIDAATGAVTVTHRVAAHDLEPALVRIAPGAQPSLDDADAVAALVAYAARAFVLRDEDGGRLALTHAATDLAGDDVRLVYTARLRPPARTVSVDSNLFEETHPDQENQVNVRRARITRTALFRPGDEPQDIRFD